MKRLSTSIWIIIIWLVSELIIMGALLIAKVPYHICSDVFLGFVCFGLLMILFQWMGFKGLNSQIRRNVVRMRSTDKMTFKLFHKKAKPDEDGKFSKEDIITARRNRGWHFIMVCVLPTLLALILTLVFAFV